MIRQDLVQVRLMILGFRLILYGSNAQKRQVESSKSSLDVFLRLCGWNCLIIKSFMIWIISSIHRFLRKELGKWPENKEEVSYFTFKFFNMFFD